MNFHNKKAIYLQIADSFFERILLKELQAGDKISSVRELAVAIEVNPNTVQRAYSFLVDKGVIANKRGIGFFVTNESAHIAMTLKKEEFVKSDLPLVFRTMKILKFSPKDFLQFYDQWLSQH